MQSREKQKQKISKQVEQNIKTKSDSHKLQYKKEAQKLIPHCVVDNPNLRDLVEVFIYDYIYEIVGPELAPKITRMLIDLSIPR